VGTLNNGKDKTEDPDGSNEVGGGQRRDVSSVLRAAPTCCVGLDSVRKAHWMTRRTSVK
jgi:hypothetical protein